MRDLIISDTQFGNYDEFANYDNKDGLNSRFLLQLDVFKQCLEFGIKKKCKNIYHLGDVFQKRGIIEPEILNSIRLCLDSYISNFLSINILTGNHDITVEGKLFNTAFSISTTKINVVYYPSIFGNVLMIPFTKKNFTETVDYFMLENELKKKDVILMMHQDIEGAVYEKHEMSGIKLDYLKQFKAVFCGHIHEPQKLAPNIHIIGAPHPMNFGDSSNRRVLIIENEKIIETFTPKHPKFITTANSKELNDYDFFRFTSEKKIEQKNVRSVKPITIKHSIRTKAKTIEEFINEYCKRENRLDMSSYGIKLFNGDKL